MTTIKELRERLYGFDDALTLIRALSEHETVPADVAEATKQVLAALSPDRPVNN